MAISYYCGFCGNQIANGSDLCYLIRPFILQLIYCRFNLINQQSEDLGPSKIQDLSCDKCEQLLGWKSSHSSKRDTIVHMHMEKLMIWNGLEHVQAIGHNENVNITTPCQVCKQCHKRCSAECVFARYFPPGNESKVHIKNMSQLFSVNKVGNLFKKYKLPLRDGVIRSILFESEGRFTSPTRMCTLIRDIQHEILETTAELQNTNSQLQAYQAANKQGQLPCSISRGKQILTYDSSYVQYRCRSCRTSIALLNDFDHIDETAPNRGFFNKVINVRITGKELLRDDGLEVDLYCDTCGDHLGMRIVSTAEGTLATVLQLNKLLLWNGKYHLEAVRTQADMPRVAAPIGPAPVAASIGPAAIAAPIGPAPIAAPIGPAPVAAPIGPAPIAAPIRQLGTAEHFAREEVIVIEDDNELSQDMLWDDVD